MSISIIAAVGKNLELGKKNDLIFKIPEDMKYFKETTLGHAVFMGFNTWKSLPGKLSQRDNYVLTHTPEDLPEGVIPVTDFDEFMKRWQNASGELFVIGGGMVYGMSLPYADTLYLTEVDEKCDDAEVFFPKFNKSSYNRTLIKKGHYHDLTYSFVKYTKK